MTKKESNKSFSKKFLVFVVISIFFWFLTKLSKVYQDTIQIKVSYINLPIDRIVKNELPSVLEVNIKASGFKLLYAQIITPKAKVDLSSLQKESENSFLLDYELQKSKIQNQLSSFMTINYFELPRIRVDFDQLESKFVQIHPNLSISFKDNFESYGKPELKPDSIKVSGPKSILDTLSRMETEFIEFIDVDKDVNKKLKIRPYYGNQGLVFKEESIGYQLVVEKFTESELDIPFILVNQPDNQNINTFPNTVRISFKIALSDYEKINKNLFVVQCDFKESQDNNLKFLIPKMISAPDFVKDVHLKTQKIDFFITK